MSLSQEELKIIKWHVPLFSTHGRIGCTIMDTYWSFPNIHSYTNVCPSRVAETLLFSNSNMPTMVRVYTEQKKYAKCDWAIKFGILVWSKNILPRGLHVLAAPSCLKNFAWWKQKPRENKGKQVVCQEQCFSVTSAGGSADPGSDWLTSKASSLGCMQSLLKLNENWKC